jgi:hypothetical protein
VRCVLAPVLVAAALVAAGCGGHTGQRVSAETEGLYLDVGEMTYQVQISRYMNPSDPEDRAYFAGLPEGATQLPGDETWFGVFLRVQNDSGQAHRAAGNIVIKDTADNKYRPVALGDENLFAYRAETVLPDSVYPQPDTIAAQGPVGNGLLLLFKLKVESLQNRPLTLLISEGAGQPSEVKLDV